MKRFLMLASFIVLSAGPLPAQAPELSTFSIVACDTVAGQWGVAIQSRVVAAGMIVPEARAGVGAIASQAAANVRFKPLAIELMESGQTAAEVKAHFLAMDSLIERRQFGVVDRHCGIANHTGTQNQPWAGARTGEHYTAQGNILTGPEVVEAMGDAFEQAERESRPLAERLLNALKAGQAAGGDSRGRQGAGLLVVQAEGGYGGGDDRYIDLRVEDHIEPILELERVYGVYMSVFHPMDIYQPLGSRRLQLPRGPDVLELQCLLDMAVAQRNGTLDYPTMRRVVAEQEARGMPASGIPNRQLIAALRERATAC